MSISVHPDTIITTASGYKAAKDLVKGDKVYTGKGFEELVKVGKTRGYGVEYHMPRFNQRGGVTVGSKTRLIEGDTGTVQLAFPVLDASKKETKVPFHAVAHLLVQNGEFFDFKFIVEKKYLDDYLEYYKKYIVGGEPSVSKVADKGGKVVFQLHPELHEEVGGLLKKFRSEDSDVFASFIDLGLDASTEFVRGLYDAAKTFGFFNGKYYVEQSLNKVVTLNAIDIVRLTTGLTWTPKNLIDLNQTECVHVNVRGYIPAWQGVFPIKHDRREVLESVSKLHGPDFDNIKIKVVNKTDEIIDLVHLTTASDSQYTISEKNVVVRPGKV